MKKNIILSLIVLVAIVSLLLSACSLKYMPGADDEIKSTDRSEIMFDEPSNEIEGNVTNRDIIKYADDEIDESDVSLTIKVIEGDLIDLQPKAVDPDDDVVRYSFSGPFNEAGLWQTEDGDEGKYLITITATDGELIVKEYVLINILPRNKGPIVECPEIIGVYETETVNIDCNVYDNEDDVFELSYSGWMMRYEYTTTYGDAGEYTVLVTAKDTNGNTIQKEINIIVKNKNRLPVITGVDDIYATEFDVIILDVSVVDDDHDNLTVLFAEPFDEDGVWVTEDGDDGAYTSYVKVSDGEDTVTERFNVYIDHINTRPVLGFIEDINITETETVEISVDAYDEENDDLTITFSGWMTTNQYTTTYDDAGTHYVKVTVSDGRLEVSQNVKINVNNVNRPPVFVIPS